MQNKLLILTLQSSAQHWLSFVHGSSNGVHGVSWLKTAGVALTDIDVVKAATTARKKKRIGGTRFQLIKPNLSPKRDSELVDMPILLNTEKAAQRPEVEPNSTDVEYTYVIVQATSRKTTIIAQHNTPTWHSRDIPSMVVCTMKQRDPVVELDRL
ncbi:hypothetical protein DFH29DRAFT_1041981 [Suillus ampliporus]|nr:hypothetical protein DFH29DRAFT_1041981 [Suillus ampliporus]